MNDNQTYLVYSQPDEIVPTIIKRRTEKNLDLILEDIENNNSQILANTPHFGEAVSAFKEYVTDQAEKKALEIGKRFGFIHKKFFEIYLTQLYGRRLEKII